MLAAFWGGHPLRSHPSWHWATLTAVPCAWRFPACPGCSTVFVTCPGSLCWAFLFLCTAQAVGCAGHMYSQHRFKSLLLARACTSAASALRNVMGNTMLKKGEKKKSVGSIGMGFYSSACFLCNWLLIMFSLQFSPDTVADAQYVLVMWPEFSWEQVFQIFQASDSPAEGRQLCLPGITAGREQTVQHVARGWGGLVLHPSPHPRSEPQPFLPQPHSSSV